MGNTQYYNQYQQAPVQQMTGYQYQQTGYVNQPVQQAVYQQPAQSQQAKSKSGFSYPEQIWSTKNDKQNLCIEDHLSLPRQQEYENGSDKGKLQPMTAHGIFSKFKLTILNYEQHRSVGINIDPKKLKSIELKTQAAELIRMQKQSQSSSDSAQSPAYTVTILGGHANIKGKTPAQAIMEDINNISLLQAQAQYLAANVSKYRGNQSQLDAINDAFTLYNAGQLQAADLPLIIYTDDKVPNKATKDAEGYTNFNSCKITCNFNMNYPIKVEIMNAKVLLNQQGNPDMQSAKDKASYSYQMTLEEWEDAVSTMTEAKRLFEENGYMDRRAVAKQSANINAGRA